MSKINFTDAKLRNLQPQNKRYSVMDAKEDGLELLVYPKGTKTFCLYKRMKGIPNHKKIGNFGDINVAQAREIANKIKTQMYDNIYLNHNEKLAKLTLNDIFENFMNSKIELGEKTINEYRRLWDKNIKNDIGMQKVLEITIDDVENFRNNLANTKYQANRCVGLIRSVYNYLIKRKTFNIVNPAVGVEKFKEEPCMRALQEDEIGNIIVVINRLLNRKQCLPYYAILLLLLIPVRKSAMLSMRWQDVNLRKKIWIIPRTKNKKNLEVNLPDAAIPLLKKLKEYAESENINSEYVFYSNKGKTGHLVDIKKSWQLVKNEAELSGRVRIHDFRHTFATFMARLTGNAYKIKTALGHNSLKSSEIYVNIEMGQVNDVINTTIDEMLKSIKSKQLITKNTNDVKSSILRATKKKIKIEIATGSPQENKEYIEKLWNEKKKKETDEN